ncbi:MAG: hypothetical protein EA383_15190 [Spirochaetaceae bacterium]|nr:MAG: hypothetical protein EA383_15190 [Spirochaetaceae bacterium]
MMKPRIGITMGDPSGIGPEIVVRGVNDSVVQRGCLPIVIGDPQIMSRAVQLNKSHLEVEVITNPAEATDVKDTLFVIPSGVLGDHDLIPGKTDKRYGESAAECCRDAVEFAKRGDIQCIVSTPFNKESFHLAGITSLDDMTYFETCFGEKDTAYMIGEIAGIWVTMVTYHVGLKDVSGLVTKKSVVEKTLGLHDVMQAADVSPINIGVAGFNPHSGEGGMFGTEEIDTIIPAIHDLHDRGLTVSGPIPPDSIFLNALDGRYNGIVSMYHDQANIARKILGRNDPGVTIYVGMPVPVLTVPHGTAFDIAWKGKARADVLIKAVRTAAKMALSTYVVSGKR